MSLYTPFIERDLAAIPDAVRAFRAEHSAEETWQAVARFAVLAYAPSQHAKHALLASLAAWELREDLDEAAFDELLIECARYAAESRQPWSEPPIMDPPEPSSGGIDELRAAVADGDRLRAERWLAGNLHNSRDLFAVAAEDDADLGHKLIVAVAAWKLAELLGEKGRYVTLRCAVWELTAYRGGGPVAFSASEEELERLIGRMVEEDGNLVAAHAVFLFDARLECGGQAAALPAAAKLPPYRLARDCAQYLKSHAVAKRLHSRFPNIDTARIVAASRHNLEHGPSLEDFSFA